MCESKLCITKHILNFRTDDLRISSRCTVADFTIV